MDIDAAGGNVSRRDKIPRVWSLQLSVGEDTVHLRVVEWSVNMRGRIESSRNTQQSLREN